MIDTKMSVDRNELRRRKLAARDKLTAADRAAKSVLIHQRLLELEEVVRAKNIMLYVNFRSEVETMPLFDILYQKKIQVTVPLTLTKYRRLVAYRITEPQTELRPGYCGILEPDTGRLSPIDPAEIDVVLVPGSVFDPLGGRLGYGGGYYDRFLANDAPQALRVSLAFDMQVVDRVPIEDHDEKMHYLVTEKNVIKIKD